MAQPAEPLCKFPFMYVFSNRLKNKLFCFPNNFSRNHVEYTLSFQIQHQPQPAASVKVQHSQVTECKTSNDAQTHESRLHYVPYAATPYSLTFSQRLFKTCIQNSAASALIYHKHSAHIIPILSALVLHRILDPPSYLQSST